MRSDLGRDNWDTTIFNFKRKEKHNIYTRPDMLNFSAPEPFPNPKTLSQLSRPRSEAIFAIPPTYPTTPRTAPGTAPELRTDYNTNRTLHRVQNGGGRTETH